MSRLRHLFSFSVVCYIVGLTLCTTGHAASLPAGPLIIEASPLTNATSDDLVKKYKATNQIQQNNH